MEASVTSITPTRHTSVARLDHLDRKGAHMEFSFSREQEDLRTSVRDFLALHSGSDARYDLWKKGYRFDRELWTAMAHQLGLQVLALPESVDGSGAGFIETAIVLEELGRDSYAGPYFSTIAASWLL